MESKDLLTTTRLKFLKKNVGFRELWDIKFIQDIKPFSLCVQVDETLKTQKLKHDEIIEPTQAQ